jgi:hypothetical protein
MAAELDVPQKLENPMQKPLIKAANDTITTVYPLFLMAKENSEFCLLQYKFNQKYFTFTPIFFEFEGVTSSEISYFFIEHFGTDNTSALFGKPEVPKRNNINKPQILSVTKIGKNSYCVVIKVEDSIAYEKTIKLLRTDENFNFFTKTDLEFKENTEIVSNDLYYLWNIEKGNKANEENKHENKQNLRNKVLLSRAIQAQEEWMNALQLRDTAMYREARVPLYIDRKVTFVDQNIGKIALGTIAVGLGGVAVIKRKEIGGTFQALWKSILNRTGYISDTAASVDGALSRLQRLVHNMDNACNIPEQKKEILKQIHESRMQLTSVLQQTEKIIPSLRDLPKHKTLASDLAR